MFHRMLLQLIHIDRSLGEFYPRKGFLTLLLFLLHHLVPALLKLLVQWFAIFLNFFDSKFNDFELFLLLFLLYFHLFHSLFHPFSSLFGSILASHSFKGPAIPIMVLLL